MAPILQPLPDAVPGNNACCRYYQLVFPVPRLLKDTGELVILPCSWLPAADNIGASITVNNSM